MHAFTCKTNGSGMSVLRSGASIIDSWMVASQKPFPFRLYMRWILLVRTLFELRGTLFERITWVKIK
jgi:hypothetical protein